MPSATRPMPAALASRFPVLIAGGHLEEGSAIEHSVRDIVAAVEAALRSVNAAGAWQEVHS